MPAPAGSGAGTASQLIRGVRRTQEVWWWQKQRSAVAGPSVIRATARITGDCCQHACRPMNLFTEE